MYRLIIVTVVMTVLAGLAFWLGWETEKAHDPLAVKMAEDLARFEAGLSSARAGDRKAQAMIGDLYRLGKGVARNPKAAVTWYEKAAREGHRGAQYMLGRMYDEGDGVPQDYLLAAKWYTLAANLGAHNGAQYRLGQLHFNGRGVAHDYDKAIRFYHKAAERGHAGAQYLLGKMYRDGWGVRKDLIESYKWLALAARQNDKALSYDPGYDAVAELETLVGTMNDYQIGRGREAMAAWVRRQESPPARRQGGR